MSQTTSKSKSSKASSSHKTEQQSQPPRPSSPLSPTRHSRMQEKADLQNLNDRLACYIDRVRYLETENSRLTREVQQSEETTERQVTDIKVMYESELNEARKLLDDTYREKVKLEIDTKRLWDENEQLKGELAKKLKELNAADSAARMWESRASELQVKHGQSSQDAKKLAHDLKEAERERDKWRKQADDLRKQLEEESLARVDVENHNQTLREELTFKDQIYQKELTETRHRRQVDISEIDGRLAEKYEAKLQATLQELRDQYEAQMASNRNEIEQLYEAKIKSLQQAANRHSTAAQTALDELRQCRARIDALTKQLMDAEQQASAHQQQARDAHKAIEGERMRHAEDLAQLELELARARDEMSTQLQEYQDLMDIKVSLDLEIAAYRKLLESEEARLNITPNSSGTGGSLFASLSSRATPMRSAPTKRKRTSWFSDSRQEDDRVFDYKVNKTCKGDVEISESDPEGRFVRLFNKSDKEISLGGWTIVRRVDGAAPTEQLTAAQQQQHESGITNGAGGDDGSEKVDGSGDAEAGVAASSGAHNNTFKFHRSVKIEANGTVTVWSSDSNRMHEPPANVVMKGQKWWTGDYTTTVLYNNAGAEMAMLERTKRQLSMSILRRREMTGGPDELHHHYGDLSQISGERCIVM